MGILRQQSRTVCYRLQTTARDLWRSHLENYCVKEIGVAFLISHSWWTIFTLLRLRKDFYRSWHFFSTSCRGTCLPYGVGKQIIFVLPNKRFKVWRRLNLLHKLLSNVYPFAIHTSPLNDKDLFRIGTYGVEIFGGLQELITAPSCSVLMNFSPLLLNKWVYHLLFVPLLSLANSISFYADSFFASGTSAIVLAWEFFEVLIEILGGVIWCMLDMIINHLCIILFFRCSSSSEGLRIPTVIMPILPVRSFLKTATMKRKALLNMSHTQRTTRVTKNKNCSLDVWFTKFGFATEMVSLDVDMIFFRHFQSKNDIDLLLSPIVSLKFQIWKILLVVCEWTFRESQQGVSLLWLHILNCIWIFRVHVRKSIILWMYFYCSKKLWYFKVLLFVVRERSRWARCRRSLNVGREN